MDRMHQLEEELRDLKSSLKELRQEIAALREESCTGKIQAMLSQRGLPVLSHSDHSWVLLPKDAPSLHKDALYALMRRYSFRLFLRELLKHPEGDHVRRLTQYCSIRTAQSYAGALSKIGILGTQPNGSYQLLNPRIRTLGPTLEWYVSQIFQREFMAPSLFGVKLKNTRHGGDHDVLAVLSDALITVEVKSSPPRGIELQEIRAFLDRLLDLRAHTAIFLVDTELRMRDKIVPHFEETLKEVHSKPEGWAVLPLRDEIFHVMHRIYLINSRRGIYTNLRHCLRDSLFWENRDGMFHETERCPQGSRRPGPPVS